MTKLSRIPICHLSICHVKQLGKTGKHVPNMEETVWAQNKDTKLANLVNQKERCSERLSSLINQQGMIIPLNKSKSERYWLLNNENCVLGFIPAINSHQKILKKYKVHTFSFSPH